MGHTTLYRGALVCISLVFFIFLGACEDTDDCRTVARNELIINSMDFNRAGAKIAFERAFDTLMVIGTEEVLYTRRDSLLSFSIPVNFNADSIAIFLKQFTRRDTLVFSYTRVPSYISPTCGIEMVVQDIALKYSTLPDSIAIIQPSLLRKNAYNVEIFQ
ncbi:DUF6452 family protein [Cytophagales bacterium LB-30]|uniref:DUF6452 family protein n=1 Tax=Shiella aurantiaca TaxID=3058365 RepID=A0ABT8F7H1_9BACT|nr:DUF6452 family protein [Shiella aurantiaca]MDN4166233.1 DUF6452 family protein [Shiella aurantiaca]